jgi:DNA-binding transcriptional ArsR family regulator
MANGSHTASDLVAWLKAAGESSRLRLLALCAERDLSVSDLAQAVAQSEPRVSRHLKILCEAGLVVRLRQGQWVHYRLTDAERAVAFVQGLLAQLNKADPVLARDRSRLLAATSTTPTARASASESRLGRALRAFMEANGPLESSHSALVVGVDHLELLEATARSVRACAAIAHSRRGAQAARAYAEREDFACRVLLATNSETLSGRDTESAGAPFDMVVLDRFTASSGPLSATLAVAKRALAPDGKLWLFDRYEALEEGPRDRAAARIVEHPIARIRRVLAEVGLTCERLSPIEADGEHMLAAVASPSVQKTSTTGVA